jgi:hypothetical protein
MRKLVASVAAVVLLLVPVCMRGGDRSVLSAKASSQAIQNARANDFDLSRMQNRAMVRRFYRAGLLVRVPSHTRFSYLHLIPAAYRYLRPWTMLFLNRLSREYHARFGHRLRVTSLIRTVSLQRRLEGRNPNAARATGPDRSSHLTGATLDISKRFMPRRGRQWVRRVLLRLHQGGYLYAVEEFEQPTFHVMVYPTYREYVAQLAHHATAPAESTD